MSNQKSSIRANEYPLLGLVPEKGTTANRPASPANARLYFDADLAKLVQYINSAWVSFVMDNDSRLTDGRAPIGAAGGALTGSYPNPTLATSAVNSPLILSSSLRGAAISNAGTAASTDLALRALGYAAGYAMPGFATLQTIATASPNTADVPFNGFKATGLADPSSAGDAATKNYVDAALNAAIQGLNVKKSAQAATTGNQSLNGLVVVDGYTLNTNDRVLVKAQTTASQNGIYVANSGAWVRALDADTAAELQSAFVFVEQGTTQANTGWYQTADNITLGTTSIAWNQFSSAGSYSASPTGGLTMTGTVFSANVDNSSIAINGSNQLIVKAGGITNAMLAGGIDLTTKVTGALPVINGGTGATTLAAARVNLGAAGVYSTTNPALTADTWSASITHNLNRSYPVVMLWELSTGEIIELDIKTIDANNIQIRSGSAVSAGLYQISVVG